MGWVGAVDRGLGHEVNDSGLDPEASSLAQRTQLLDALYGSASTIGALPSSGNWKGRRRWVDSLNSFAEWTGTEWRFPGATSYGRVVRTTNQSLGSNNETLSFDTMNVSELMARSGGGVVVQVPGVYAVSASLSIQQSSAHTFRDVYVRRNGTVQGFVVPSSASSSSVTSTPSVARIMVPGMSVRCAIGDVLELSSIGSSAGTLLPNSWMDVRSVAA